MVATKSISILEASGISKRFPGVQALDNVGFEIQSGEIHGLIGENGAGKSTFIKIVGGAYHADSGTIKLDGEPFLPLNPEIALQSGIAIVHQELSLCENMNVAENLLFNRHPHKMTVIDRKKLVQHANEFLNKFDIDISPGEKVENLSLAVKEQIEILRAISYKPKLLILDEPTGPLSKPQANQLFTILEDLRNKGVSILYISHNMTEVLGLCERITIFRDGKYIQTVVKQNVTEEHLANLMVGRDLGDMFPDLSKGEEREPVLEVKKLSCRDNFSDISFALQKGEILGVAGLIGSKRTELALTIFGAFKKEAGSVLLDGKELHIQSPKDAIKKGIAYLSEDRRLLGLFLNFSIAENILSINLEKYSNYGVINKRLLRTQIAKHIKELNIVASGPDHVVRQLSGGNQQKTLLAKWLSVRPQVLIIDEPTRGIDVGAKKAIYELLRELANSGISILLISSELLEILGMSDRIMLMDSGSLIGIFPNTEEITEEFIMNKIVDYRRRDTSFEK
jgi:inositol transport system ATP-binding protein